MFTPTEISLLLLLLITTIIMVYHYFVSREPFVNFVSDVGNQVDVDNRLDSYKKAAQNLKREYNTEDATNKNLDDFYKHLSSSVEKKIIHMDTNVIEQDEIANNRIRKLEDELKYYEEQASNVKDLKHPKTIKSIQDGKNLSVLGTDNGSYLIAVNGGCLKVASNGSYDIAKCNPADKSQYFRLDKIYDDTQYDASLSMGLDKLEKTDNIRYPFSMVRSDNTDNCLKNNFGNVSVEPCVVSQGQRWKLLNEEIQCNK
jgi:hypothetical protein